MHSGLSERWESEGAKWRAEKQKLEERVLELQKIYAARAPAKGADKEPASSHAKFRPTPCYNSLLTLVNFERLVLDVDFCY